VRQSLASTRSSIVVELPSSIRQVPVVPIWAQKLWLMDRVVAAVWQDAFEP
jgi:hypothetical protein